MNNKRIQSNLRTLLNKHGLEQKQLAEMTGLSVRTISELANDKMKHYPKKAIQAIANALDVDDINELLTLIDDDEAE